MQLISVEAINIYSSVYDTEQLSVIRGSSFLLKNAIMDVKEKFKNNIQAVSTGASSGLFSFKSCDNAERMTVRDIVAEITQYLNKSESYRHFTFVVSYADNSDFQLAKEILVAKQRFKQLQSIAVAPDPATDDPATDDNKQSLDTAHSCAIQGNRQTAKKYTLSGNKEESFISLSVFDRIREGIDNRSDFYQKELVKAAEKPGAEKADNNVISELKFTSDIQSLAASTQYTKLSDKIAVLYLDGNKFSSIQRDKVASKEEQIKFDKTIQAYRRNFLSEILNKFNNNSKASLFFANTKNEQGELRLETLLWGGDEIIFVVPAWSGMDLLYFFYECSKNWNYDHARLTHAGGIVFCSSKTPISKIRKVANDLADEIKEKDYGRKNNYFDYVVLESIDYPVEGSMADFFTHHYGNVAATRYALSPVEDWFAEKGVKYQLKKILSELPKGQIYKIVNEVTGSVSLESSAGDGPGKAEARLQALIGESRYEELSEIFNALFSMPMLKDASASEDNGAGHGRDNNPPAFNALWKWVYLLELWDYLMPELKNSKKGNADG